MPRRSAPRRRNRLAGPAVVIATLALLAHHTSTSHGQPTGADLVAKAESVEGDPYIFGAKGPDAFDCSGLVQWSVRQLGISAPPSSELQWGWVTRISYNELAPGDLIFEQWPGDPQAPPGHVMIYAGHGQVVEAPEPGGHVQVRRWYPTETHIVGYGSVPGMSY